MQTQRSFELPYHGDQARAEILLELAFLRHERGHAAVEGDDLAVDGAAHRHADRVDLAAQLAHRSAEAARADVLERLVDRGPEFAVRLGVLHLQLVEERFALGRRAGGEEGAADHRLRDRHRGADVGQRGHAVAAAAGLDVDHVQPVANAHRYGAVAVVGELFHHRARDLAHVHGGEQRVADREHRRTELVFAQAHVVPEVAELGQRIGEARDGRLGQPRAHRDLLVAEQRLEGGEAAQHFQAARQGCRELPIAFMLVAEGTNGWGKRCRGFWGAHGKLLWYVFLVGGAADCFAFRYSVGEPSAVNLVVPDFT